MGMLTLSARADQWDKKTILTVDQPIQVTDTLLEPGKYVFKLADSSSDRHIVQIYNGDQTKMIDTVLAIPNYRLQPTGHSRFTFWETPPGTARSLRAWFYPGDNVGQEFRYPKHLAMLETSAPVAAPAPQPSTARPTEQEVHPKPPEPQSLNQERQEEQPAAGTAQSTSPPASELVTEHGPAQKEHEPATLPKTASSYPLIGISGLLSLGIYSFLRLKRSA
jgi:hypothetical protein